MTCIRGAPRASTAMPGPRGEMNLIPIDRILEFTVVIAGLPLECEERLVDDLWKDTATYSTCQA